MYIQTRSNCLVLAFCAVCLILSGCESTARQNQRNLAAVTLRETVDYEQALRDYSAAMRTDVTDQVSALDEAMTHQEIALEKNQLAVDAGDLADRLLSRPATAPLNDRAVRIYIQNEIESQDTEISKLATQKADLLARQKQLLDATAVKEAKVAALRKDLEKLQSPLSFDEQANELQQLVSAAIDAQKKKK